MRVWLEMIPDAAAPHGTSSSGAAASLVLLGVHLVTVVALLCLTKAADESRKYCIFFLSLLDLVLLLCSVFVWSNTAPQTALAIVPFRSAMSGILAAALANTLLYRDLVPFRGLREDIAALLEDTNTER